jgi:hypothetical protein
MEFQMTNEQRQAIEARIMQSAIEELLSYDFTLGVNDGESVTIHHSTDAAAVFAALRTTDDDYLLAYTPGAPITTPGHEGRVCTGWVRFVYGNDGWDVICDHSTNLEDYLTKTNDLAEQLSEVA